MKTIESIAIETVKLLRILICIPPAFAFSIQVTPTASAQSSLACGGLYEAIVTIADPVFDKPAFWRSTFGKDGFDHVYALTAALPKSEGSILATGISTPPIPEDAQSDTLKSTKSTKSGAFMALLSGKGNTLWQKYETGNPVLTIKDIITLDNQYIALGEIQTPTMSHTGLRVAFYDPRGNLKKKFVIRDDLYSYEATDIEPAFDNNGVIILGWATHTKHPQEHFSFFIHLDKNGRQILRRNFNLGIGSKLLRLNPLADGSFLATGWIQKKGTDQRDDSTAHVMGWLVRLSHRGAIMWEHSYPAGKAATLTRAIDHPQGGYVVIGKSVPFDTNKNVGSDAALGMWINETGTPKWKRFWNGNYRYRAQDVLYSGDGRFYILASADTNDEHKIRHALVLTTTLRGQIITHDAFIEGSHSFASNIMQDSHGRYFMAGNAQAYFSESGENPLSNRDIYDAWVVALRQAEPYQDPCDTNSTAPADTGNNISYSIDDL